LKKLGGDVKMTPNEKFLNFQQRLITNSNLNQKIKQNPDIILKNEALMDQMSTQLLTENGDIIKVKPNLHGY
jgi:isocitrate dehydrogenase